MCVVDDLQWLDDASARALGFVARRLLAEPVALVFAVREPSGERHLAGLPELWLEGSTTGDARALLETVDPGPDRRARPRPDRGGDAWQSARAAGAAARHERDRTGGRLRAPTGALSRGVEDGFRRRIDALPADTRRLLQLAAADPVGEPLLVWRAAERLGIDRRRAPARRRPAGDRRAGAVPSSAGALGGVRSAPAERHTLHAALAEATDPTAIPTGAHGTARRRQPDPTRRSPTELERSAARAQARGGIAAAAAFLEMRGDAHARPRRRVRRLLAAARAKRDAGALDAALRLLIAAETGPIRRCRPPRSSTCGDRWPSISAASATPRGCSSARPSGWSRWTPKWRARHTSRRWARRSGPEIWAARAPSARGGRSRPRPPRAPGPPGAVDVVVDALAVRLTEGYAAAAPALEHALETVVALKRPAGDPAR